MKKEDKLSIGFIHPDLGFGGAERLIVDAAVGIQKHHKVQMYTQFHDRNRCFEETRDGTLSVNVYGSWIPRSTCGFFHVFWAIIRMIYCTLRILLTSRHDIYIVDQVSASVPFIKWLTRSKVIFYCHFPDKYLARPGGLAKRLYRVLFDYIEEWTLRYADLVLVNSRFTQRIYCHAFPHIPSKPAVLYPSLDQKSYDMAPTETSRLSKLFKSKRILTSLNRFERKKNHMLALESFVALKREISNFDAFHLVIAGGYDARLPENVSVRQELEEFAEQTGVSEQVTFVPSFSNADRFLLLHDSEMILYTPRGEHFGIVPVEAMYCECPVIALKSGGPKESIKHGVTGLLVDIDEEDTFDTAGITPKNSKALISRFTQAICTIIGDKSKRSSMGKAGRTRVIEHFSIDSFVRSLNQYVQDVYSNHVKQS